MRVSIARSQRRSQGKSPDKAAKGRVASKLDYFPDDPCTVRLFEVARESHLPGRYIDLVKLPESEIEKQSGPRVPLNPTGAIGALLCEIDFPVEAMRGVAIISRSAGLLAHVLEELESNTAWPVMQMVMKAIPYDDGD